MGVCALIFVSLGVIDIIIKCENHWSMVSELLE